MPLLAIIVLFFTTHLFGNESFYAISSLRFLIEEGESCQISFEEADLQALWQKANQCPLPAIKRAEIFYHQYDKIKCLECLEQAWHQLRQEEERVVAAKSVYPNVDDNKTLPIDVKRRIKPYLIPLKHPIQPALDTIFSQSRATLDETAFAKAGFVTLEISHANFLRIALHPSVPKYMFKIYLDNELRTRNQKPAWECLVDRCKGAENIRKLIKKKGLRHFAVPDKWLYPLPQNPPPGILRHPVILVETNMELVGREECMLAWKQATPEVLDELFCILSHGYASTYLVANVPYTKKGKFACIDTEYPKRKLKYSHARDFFSKKMQVYWDRLIKNGGRL